MKDTRIVCPSCNGASVVRCHTYAAGAVRHEWQTCTICQGARVVWSATLEPAPPTDD